MTWRYRTVECLPRGVRYCYRIIVIITISILRSYPTLRKWTETFTRRRKRIHEGHGADPEANLSIILLWFYFLFIIIIIYVITQNRIGFYDVLAVPSSSPRHKYFDPAFRKIKLINISASTVTTFQSHVESRQLCNGWLLLAVERAGNLIRTSLLLIVSERSQTHP